MPDKEGSDDEKKSTKSVVNKKQKQFMNQEELDLTKIAEAFGGYVVEAKYSKGKDERSRSIDRFMDTELTPDVFNVPSEEEAAKRQAKKQIEKSGGTQSDRIGKTGSGKFKEPVSGTPKAKGYKPKGKIKLGDTTKTIGGLRTYKIGQKPPKPLKDRVQAKKDSLDKRIKDRSTGKTRKIPRVVGASGEKPSGSIARGTYKSSPAGQDAYKLKKSDLEARQGIKDAGGTGDIGFNAPGRKEKVQKRETRATGLGTPSPEKPITPPKRTPIPKDTGSLEDVPKVKQQFKSFRKKLDDLKTDVKVDSDIESRIKNPKTATTVPEPSQNPELIRRRNLGAMGGDSNFGSAEPIPTPRSKSTGSKKVTPPTPPKPTKLPGNRGSRSYLKPRPSAVRVIGRETGEAAAKKAMKKTMQKGLAKGLSKQIPGVGSVIAGAEGAYRLAKGDMTGAALSFGQAIPGVSIPLAAMDIARDMKKASKVVGTAKAAKQTARMSKNVLLPKGAKSTSAIVKYKPPKVKTPKGIDPTVVGSAADQRAQFGKKVKGFKTRFAQKVGPTVAPSVTKAMKYIQDPKNMGKVMVGGAVIGKGTEMMMRDMGRRTGAALKPSGLRGGRTGRRSAKQ